MQSDQKSYKIRLSNSKHSFLGYEILNLNKHPFDEYRVRNKIAFDIFSLIPDMVSMRTELVNLYINDMTNDMVDVNEFIDYGLFTHIEQPNKKFLKDHNLDTEGILYKAEYFEFFRYKDSIRNINDPLYDEEDFVYHLDPKISENHEKIIKMLDDVNNYNLDINKVLDRHFNRDNYFTWLAVNILLGNYDTKTQNYYLYSPHDNLAWYILPWDYDGSMMEDLELLYDANGNFQALVGIANYWNSVLHNRVFREPNNLIELNNKIEEIYPILSKERLYSEAIRYIDIVNKEYQTANKYDEYNKGMLIDQIELISNTTEINKDLYYESLEKPMPIFLGEVERNDQEYLFYWDESFDLQGDRLSYDFQISYTPDFTEIYFEKTRIRDTSYKLYLEPGEYYWRAVVVDSKSNKQRAMDQLFTGDGRLYHGLKHIIIE